MHSQYYVSPMFEGCIPNIYPNVLELRFLKDYGGHAGLMGLCSASVNLKAPTNKQTRQQLLIVLSQVSHKEQRHLPQGSGCGGVPMTRVRVFWDL